MWPRLAIGHAVTGPHTIVPITWTDDGQQRTAGGRGHGHDDQADVARQPGHGHEVADARLSLTSSSTSLVVACRGGSPPTQMLDA
jgi:hypothetical protein